MDTELLKTFLEVRNTRHFGLAATNLYLSQAAVSARIRQLEEMLGAPLFHRFRNNLQLTQTGERFVRHAEAILQAWDLAQQDVAVNRGYKQVFSIGSTGGIWDMVLQRVLVNVLKADNDLAIRAESLSYQDIVTQLLSKTLDFSVLFEVSKLDELISQPLGAVRLALISDTPEQTAADAMRKRFIAVDWGIAFQVSFTQSCPDAPPPSLHTNLAQLALEILLNEGGCAYLPLHHVQHLLGHRLFEVAGAPVIDRQLFGCFHRSKNNDQVISLLCEEIRQAILTSPKTRPET